VPDPARASVVVDVFKIRLEDEFASASWPPIVSKAQRESVQKIFEDANISGSERSNQKGALQIRSNRPRRSAELVQRRGSVGLWAAGCLLVSPARRPLSLALLMPNQQKMEK
jgi:hypothetical protein